MKKTLVQQESLVTAAVKLLWFSECMESKGSSQPNIKNNPKGNVFQNQVSLQEPHYVNMFGNNKMLPWGKLCKLIMDEIKTLSACGHLHNTILTGVRQLQQPSPYDDTLVNVASTRLHWAHSQQLGNTLLDLFTDLIRPGKIDETLEGAVMEVLLSGELDAVISNTLALLENKVCFWNVWNMLLYNIKLAPVRESCVFCKTITIDQHSSSLWHWRLELS